MDTLRFLWYVSKQTKTCCFFNDISTTPTQTYRLLDFLLIYHEHAKWLCVVVDISSNTQRVHLQFCCYIINSAKCPIVSFAILMIYQQPSNWPLCFFYQTSLINQQQKQASTQLGFVLISINSTSCRLYVWQTNKIVHWLL